MDRYQEQPHLLDPHLGELKRWMWWTWWMWTLSVTLYLLLLQSGCWTFSWRWSVMRSRHLWWSTSVSNFSTSSQRQDGVQLSKFDWESLWNHRKSDLWVCVWFGDSWCSRRSEATRSSCSCSPMRCQMFCRFWTFYADRTQKTLRWVSPSFTHHKLCNHAVQLIWVVH